MDFLKKIKSKLPGQKAPAQQQQPQRGPQRGPLSLSTELAQTMEAKNQAQNTRALERLHNEISVEVPVHQDQNVYHESTASWSIDRIPWRVHLIIVVDDDAQQLLVRVPIQVSDGTSSATFTVKSNWLRVIQENWNNTAKLVVPYYSKSTNAETRRVTYDIHFEVEWRDSDDSRPVYAVQTMRTTGVVSADWRDAQAKYSAIRDHRVHGTPNLGQWGDNDREGIAHEFGHAIGNPDEYNTKRFMGANLPANIYDQDPFTTDSIMNNTQTLEGLKIYPRHFDFLKRHFETAYRSVLNARQSATETVRVDTTIVRIV
jgi:hypothetical protein